MSAESIRCSGCGGSYASCGCSLALAEREARTKAREERIERIITMWAGAAVAGFQRESHMTLLEHVTHAMRMVVNDLCVMHDMEDASVDAEWRARLRPLLSVGEAEDGELWCLWLIPDGIPDEVAERMPAVYGRPPTDAEDERIEAGVAEWGPGVEEMLTEWLTAARRGGAK